MCSKVVSGLLAALMLCWIMPAMAASTLAHPFLDAEELAFVRADPVLRVHNELDWPPYNFNDGAPAGYSIDFFDLVAENAGFQVEYVSGPSWSEFMAMIENRDIDVMLNIAETPDRRRFLLFTRPYLIASAGIYVRNGNEALDSLADLKGRTVAVPRGFFFEERLRKYSPEIELIPRRNTLESLLAVASGEADATIGTVDVQDYLIRQQGLDNLLLANHLDDNRFTAVMNIAVHRDNPLLHRILQKSMDALDEDAVARIRQRWTHRRTVQNLGLSPGESRFLDSHPAIRVMIGEPQPPFSLVQNDRISGYAVDLTHLLAEKMGVEILFNTAPPDLDPRQVFRRRLADILITTPEAAKQAGHALLSAPLISTYHGIATRHDGAADTPLAHLVGQSIAVVRDQGLGAILADQPGAYRILQADNDLAALEAVSHGDAVAALGAHPVQRYLIRQNFMADLGTRPLSEQPGLGRSHQVFAVRPDWPALAPILDKALAAVSQKEFGTVQARWQMDLQGGSLPGIALTDPERRYLADLKELRVCRNPEWVPALSGTENQGMTRELMNLLSRRIDRPIELVATDSWQDSMQALWAGHCQMLAQAMPSADLDASLIFTHPYLSFSAVIATRDEELFVKNLAQVLDRRIAVVAGLGLQEQLSARYPDLELVQVASVQEGLAMVRAGEVYGLVDAIPSIGASLHRLGYDDVKIAGQLEEHWHLSFALRPEDRVLRSIMDKAIDSIPLAQRQEIYDRWTSITYVRDIDYRLVWQVVLGFTLLLAFLLYRYRSLRHHNRKLFLASEELRQAHAALTRVNAELLEKSRRLEELSITDQLTRVHNRLRLHDILTREIARGDRYGSTFSVIMLDVDDFKQINDRHGHHVGDEVLRRVAASLRDHARITDTVGRWGGEEFLIVCPDTDYQGAGRLANLMRERLRQLAVDGVERITASFGVASYQPGESKDSLSVRVDKAMYRAKALGKDRVEGATGEPAAVFEEG